MGSNAGKRLMIWLMVLALTAPTQILAQATGKSAGTEERYTYTQEQLDQLLAPIALYSDTLLSQILMASTYPLEVVEADRWLKRNPGLSGEKLDEALKATPWDPSVKSLCHFPRVLDMMSTRLEDTSALGNAVLNQSDEVMDTIQKLRAKAQSAGHLGSSDKERVIVEGPYISIEPVAPEVVYVPAYDPCWVYGPWWYPDCAPLWFWWPDVVVGFGFWWGPPIFFGRLHGWCGFHWRDHRIFVNVNRAAILGRVGITRLHGGVETWQHNPIHRRGVAYPDLTTARRFGQAPRSGVEARRNFRGFTPRSQGSAPPRSFGSERSPIEPGRRPEGFSRPQIQRPSMPESRIPRAEQPREGTGTVSPPRFQQPRTFSPFEGVGRSGPEVRQHSERGFQSMGGGHPNGARGGGGPTQRR